VGPLTVRMLESAGYEVTLVLDGTLAIRAAADNHFDLLLTDLVLGGLDGHDVADAVRAIDPSIRILFVSGYATSRYGGDPSDPIIAKPFTRSQLLARVERELAR
jgi:CheY-like chemotaxis protein